MLGVTKVGRQQGHLEPAPCCPGLARQDATLPVVCACQGDQPCTQGKGGCSLCSTCAGHCPVLAGRFVGMVGTHLVNTDRLEAAPSSSLE